jgi:hypothetical protein
MNERDTKAVSRPRFHPLILRGKEKTHLDSFDI